jgi:hypothetical protein
MLMGWVQRPRAAEVAMTCMRSGVIRAFVLGAALLAGLFVGCRSESRREPAPASAASGQPDAMSNVSRSDTRRAEEAIDDNQRAMSGERRPHEPAQQPVVNQPALRR